MFLGQLFPIGAKNKNPVRHTKSPYFIIQEGRQNIAGF